MAAPRAKSRARAGNKAGGRRRGWLVFLLGAGLLVALFFLLRNRPAARAASPSPPSPKVSRLPDYLQPAAPKPVPLPGMDRKALYNRNKVWALGNQLRAIELQINYPRWTRPLQRALVYHAPEPYKQRITGPKMAQPTLTVWCNKLDYQADDPILVYAQATDESGTPLRLDSISGHTDPEMNGRPELPLAFEDEGTDGDASAGDRVYTAKLVLSEEEARAQRGTWSFYVEAEVEGGAQREGKNIFRIQAVDAVLTGTCHDAIEDGSLAVYADVDVKAASQQHLEAELWAGDQPIASAWKVDQLDSGMQTMRLVFYGKVIRDQGIDGPYTVRHMILTTMVPPPDGSQLAAPPLDPALTTQAYTADQFTDVAINQGNSLLMQQLQQVQSEMQGAANGLDEPGRQTISPPMSAADKLSLPLPQ